MEFRSALSPLSLPSSTLNFFAGIILLSPKPPPQSPPQCCAIWAQLAHFPGIAMTSDVSALHLLLTGDPTLFAIVRLSLLVSLSAVFFAALIGVPAGALLALTQFVIGPTG